jgi:hypothetical protein
MVADSAKIASRNWNARETRVSSVLLRFSNVSSAWVASYQARPAWFRRSKAGIVM